MVHVFLNEKRVLAVVAVFAAGYIITLLSMKKIML